MGSTEPDLLRDSEVFSLRVSWGRFSCDGPRVRTCRGRRRWDWEKLHRLSKGIHMIPQKQALLFLFTFSGAAQIRYTFSITTHLHSQFYLFPRQRASKYLCHIHASSDSSLCSDSYLQLISEDFSSSCLSFRSKHFKRQNHPLVYTSPPPSHPFSSWCPVPPHYRSCVTSLIRENSSKSCLFLLSSIPHLLVSPQSTSN